MYFEFEAKHERVFFILQSVSAAVRLHVQIRIRLDSPLMNWTSTREYLEVSNVFVWYKANGSVCYFCDSLVIVVVDLLQPLTALSN